MEGWWFDKFFGKGRRGKTQQQIDEKRQRAKAKRKAKAASKKRNGNQG